MTNYANEWVLDLSDEGYWLARWHHQTYPIGFDKEKALATIDQLNSLHRPNLERREHDLYVCQNEHDKSLSV